MDILPGRTERFRHHENVNSPLEYGLRRNIDLVFVMMLWREIKHQSRLRVLENHQHQQSLMANNIRCSVPGLLLLDSILLQQ